MVDVNQTPRENNQIRDEDRGVHDWYRFVLSFPPHLVRKYLVDFGAIPGQTILDPFCGTGTVLVEAQKQGYLSNGIEANPVTFFASQVKTNWQIDIDAFVQHSRQIGEDARLIFSQQGLELYDDLPLFASTQSTCQLQTLNSEQMKLLLTHSISPRPLHRVLVLRDLIRTATRPWTAHQELALAAAMVADASNLKFGPEVGVSRTLKNDVDVVNCWYERIRQMAVDLRNIAGFIPSIVYHGDARKPMPFEPHHIDYVITSPPYPNEKDYTRATRLESVVLGFMNSPQDLRAIKKNLVRSNTRNIYSTDEDDQGINRFSSVIKLAEQIEAKRLELGKTSGFEKLYHRVVRLYFGGMRRHLEALKPVLVPGALCAYVVGDQESFFRTTIRTGQLLAEIAEYCGYQVERIDLWRTRLATVTGTQLREEVVVLRWLGY